MKKWILTICLSFAATTYADLKEQPLVGKWMLKEFEVRDAEEGHPVTWDAAAWIGKDLNKLWLKSEGERHNGVTEEGELQLLWSRAMSPFWDLQLGGRLEFQPDDPRREWLTVGINGLAPYFLETDIAFFAGKSGRTALRVETEYEMLLTQRLVLAPEVELNLHGKDDRETGTGSGLSHIELGLRLRYEIRREFAPYIGINWERLYGDTADFARAAGEDIEDTHWVLGLRIWF